ncbi:hypothetical protein NMG60_11001000 [Bertholletia excelsa]
MCWEVIVWSIAFIMNIALIGSNFYQFVLHGMFCALFLMVGRWFMFLVSLPLAWYNANLFMKQQHLVDVTEVFRFLNAEKKSRIIKFSFYLLLFILVLIRLICLIYTSFFIFPY